MTALVALLRESCGETAAPGGLAWPPREGKTGIADEIQLLFSTGDEEIDQVLRGVVGAFEAASPGRLRTYLLAGSHAEGTATATSDLDLSVVFKAESHPRDTVQRSGRLLRSLAARCRVELDATHCWEPGLLAYEDGGDAWAARSAVPRRVYAKLAKRPVYGADIRARVLLPAVADWTRALVRDAVGRLGGLRGSPARLVFPLAYPDPQDPLFGYARHRCRARDGRRLDTTRLLVRGVLDAANALVWTALGSAETRPLGDGALSRA